MTVFLCPDIDPDPTPPQPPPTPQASGGTGGERPFRIEVRSHRGRFNLMDPAQESVSTFIAIYDRTKNTRLHSCNVHTPEIVTLDPFGGCAQIREWVHGYIDKLIYSSTRDEDQAFLNFVDANNDQLEHEMLLAGIEEFTRQRDHWQLKLDRANDLLAFYTNSEPPADYSGALSSHFPGLQDSLDALTILDTTEVLS